MLSMTKKENMGFDTLIVNGTIIDGTGRPRFKADVGIRKGKVEKIGKRDQSAVNQVINAEGLIVAPGFIDIHQHGEIHLLINPQAESLIHQGITTMLGGNCGWSAAPITPTNKALVHSPWWPQEVKPTWSTFKDLFEIYERHGIAINVANLVGHGWLRSAVIGWEARSPSDTELLEMKAHTVKAMEDGVFGLSSGLNYPPGCWSDTLEVVELCKVVAQYGGFYATHDRGGPWPRGKEEAIEIGEQADLPVHISHIETHKRSWGRLEEVLQRVRAARARGLDVTFDICTTIYGGGWLVSSVLPLWACEGGAPKMMERVRDSTTRERMKQDILNRGAPTWEDIIVLWTRAHPEVKGMNVAEISKLWQKNSWDTVYDLLMDEGMGLVEVDSAVKSHRSEDLELAFKQPSCMPNTDSWFYAPYGLLGKRSPHPRGYGGFTIVFRKWVRGETRPDMPEEVGVKLVSLEDAVRKMSALPAQRLGLVDRGCLQEGVWADIVIFDTESITDTAPYPHPGDRSPHRYSEGIHYVFVNGEIVVDDGQHTGKLPGSVLRGPGFKKTDPSPCAE